MGILRDASRIRAVGEPASRKPWNKGVEVGQKAYLTPRQVASIKKALTNRSGRTALRDTALFYTAIDTMLHACDLLSMRVSDVMHQDGTLMDTIVIGMRGSETVVHCTLSHDTQIELKKWICESGKASADCVFTGVYSKRQDAITPRQLSRLVKAWVKQIDLDPEEYSTETLRRTRAVHIATKTGNLEAVRVLLGHDKLESTAIYLGAVDHTDPLDISRKYEL